MNQRFVDSTRGLLGFSPRLAHAALTRDEAAAAATRSNQLLRAAQAALDVERKLREKLEERVSASSLRLAVAVTVPVKSKLARQSAGAETDRVTQQSGVAAKPIAKTPMKKVCRKVLEVAPQPVKWWVKKQT